jgi:hypothetical protein
VSVFNCQRKTGKQFINCDIGDRQRDPFVRSFTHGKFEQTITRQHVLLRQESLIDTVTIILCLHVLITYFMLFYLITLIGGDSCRDCM